MYKVHREIVPHRIAERARRRLLLELRRCGVTSSDIAEWSRSTWWPSLRDEPELQLVRSYLDIYLRLCPAGRWADTQILVRLPDEDDVELGPPHLDELPPWAGELRYTGIYSAELSDASQGGIVVYPDGKRPVRVPLRAGDVLEMSPELLHSGSPNYGGDIRMALIFRRLA